MARWEDAGRSAYLFWAAMLGVVNLENYASYWVALASASSCIAWPLPRFVMRRG
jgi:hypothetical protein